MEGEVAGWGATNLFTDTKHAQKCNHLNELKLKVVDKTQCLKNLPGSRIHDHEFCLRPLESDRSLSLVGILEI